MSFGLAVAVVTATSLVVLAFVAAELRSSTEDEPPSPPRSPAPRQAAVVVVAALLWDEQSVMVTFAPPGAGPLASLPARDWGTVVVERPRLETARTLEAWRQSGERLVLVAETRRDEDARQVRLGVPDGATVVLSA